MTRAFFSARHTPASAPASLRVALGAYGATGGFMLLLLAGVVLALSRAEKGPGVPSKGLPKAMALLPWLGATVGPPAAVGGATAFGLWPLFLFFLKVGSVLYGSGAPRYITCGLPPSTGSSAGAGSNSTRSDR